jgi:archaellin
MNIFLSISFILLFLGGCNDCCAPDYIFGLEVKIEDIGNERKVIKIDDTHSGLSKIRTPIYIIERNNSISPINGIDINKSVTLISGSDENKFYIYADGSIYEVDLDTNSKNFYSYKEFDTYKEFVINHNEYTSLILNNIKRFVYTDIKNDIQLEFLLPTEIINELNISKTFNLYSCIPLMDNPKEWNKKDILCDTDKGYSIWLKYSDIETWEKATVLSNIDLYFHKISFTNGKTINLLQKVKTYSSARKNTRGKESLVDFRQNPKIYFMVDDKVELIEFDKIFTGHKLYKEITHELSKKPYDRFPKTYFSENDMYVVYRSHKANYFTYEFYDGDINSTEPTLSEKIYF